MNRRCREIQSILAEAGAAALREDAVARQHLVDCEECTSFAEALGALDAALLTLPRLDAPDAAVERVLQRTQTPPPSPAHKPAHPRFGPERRRRMLAWLGRPRLVVPAAVACLALVLTGRLVTDDFASQDKAPVGQTRIARSSEPTQQAIRGPVSKDENVVRLDDMRREQLRALGYVDTGAGGKLGSSHSEADPRQASERSRLVGNASATLLAKLDAQLALGRSQRLNEAFGYLGGAQDATGDDLANRPTVGGLDALRPGRKGPRRYVDVGRLEKESAARTEADAGTPSAPPDEETRAGKAKRRLAPSLQGSPEVRSGEIFGDRDTPESDFFARNAAPEISPVRRFQQERSTTEGIAFQTASGYWANTFVPGDPALRWLQASLLKRDPTVLRAVSEAPLVLDAAARPATQHFDAPSQAALDVFVHSDRNGVEGPARTLLQVGLQATERAAGLRPAMSVGIVLDLRGELPVETAASIRALVEAFEDAKDPGDRFRLIVAGRPGATVVGADQFRHGPIQVALAGLFEGGAGGETLDLLGALETALHETLQSDDPSAPLGSSLVVLVTGQRLAELLEPVARIAHQGAVAGVPLSVVGIGDGADAEEIERVTLAGQGHRRWLAAARDADAVVARELAAQSRVVARAVRLGIRLAPGVELVEVVGAERLEATHVQRVRHAERSIDNRLARNLGIEADRGEDEDGVQIVIPAFYSGDSHVVLLDVVVPGSGPLVEVTARYKDLVHLRNGVARSSLTLGREVTPPGPLERNVVKNLLAIRLAETLKTAGRELLEGEDTAAIARVRDFQTLLAGLAAELPGLRGDPDLETDAAMLAEYLDFLLPRVLSQPEPRLYLAESLQVAGYLKTLPRMAAE